MDNGMKFMLGKLYYRLEMVDDAIQTLESIDTNVYSNLRSLRSKENFSGSAIRLGGNGGIPESPPS